MLVLNNLPNVQILNGKSTKDEDDDDDDDEEDEDRSSNDNNEHNEIKNNRNNHLYPQMEEIEEDKNMENNNSNYVSGENNNNNNYNNSYENINKDNINGNVSNSKIENINEKINIPRLNIQQDNEINKEDEAEGIGEGEGEGEGQGKNMTLLYNKIISDNSNKNILINNNNNNNNYNNKENLEQNNKRESFYDLQNKENNNNNNNNNNNDNKKEDFLIDLTNEELNLLKEDKNDIYYDFVSILKEFCETFNIQENDEENKLENVYINKIKEIENKKGNIPNYYYLHLLQNKKMKIIKQLFDELFPYILNKLPEINRNNILIKLYNELFNTIKVSKDLMSTMHIHIESYNNENEKNNNNNIKSNNNENINNNMNEIIKEKNDKISLLQSQREELLKNLKEDRSTYEKKIASLEKENKIMTNKLLDKVTNITTSPINDQKATISPTSKNLKLNSYGQKQHINFRNHSQTPVKSRENTKFENYNKNKRNINYNLKNNKTRSPVKSTDNTISFENYNLNTYVNNITTINTNKHQLIPLKTLKDFINELYTSKTNYDSKCIEFKLPKETLEEHMYTFLNKKYGLKNLIIDWARNVINGIKYYSKKDSFVLLFGKIMRNEQEEEARFIIQKVAESIEELLLYYIKRQNPLKSVNEIKKIFERKKKSELFEEEWKGIIYSIYEKSEAEEIEKKLEIYINKENEKKKLDMFKKYKDSRINKNYRNNNFIGNNNSTNVNNSYYLNTINSYNNGLNTSSSPNNNISYMKTINNPTNINSKLSRVEKYNMLLFPDEKNILFSDFIKIVLDNHIRFRDKQLKNFVDIFKSVDTNKDGIISEEEFTELVQRMKVFKEDEVENKIFQFLEKIDPFDNQKITFSECVSFFSGEIIKDIDINGNEKEISILEKVCFNDDKNRNGNIHQNHNEYNENEQTENSMQMTNNNNNINKSENNNNEDIDR